MASFNSGYYGNGGFQFESSSLSRERPVVKSSSVMFDDREYDDKPTRGQLGINPALVRRHQQQEPPRPQQRESIYPAQSQRFQPDDPGEEYDDYRPGTMSAMNADDGFDDDFDDEPFDGFDDGFDDDDFGDTPRRDMRTPAQPQHREYGMGYSRYDDDYTQDDYEAEFAGVHSIGDGRKKLKQQRQEQQSRAQRSGDRGRDDYYDDYDSGDDGDGYYGKATIRDGGNGRDIGVPRVFADYFDDDYMEERRTGASKKNGKNMVSSSAAFKRRRALAVTMAVLCICAVAGAVTAYFSMLRVKAPLNVSTALTNINTDISNQLIKSSVDSTLASKAFTVSYTTSSGQQKSGTFGLGSCDFEYSTQPDGTEEYIEVGDSPDKTEKQTLKTIGTVRFNETKVKEFLYRLVGDDGVRMMEPKFEVKLVRDPQTWDYTGTLAITAGSNGFGIDYDTFINKVIKQISENNFNEISSELTTTITPEIDVDKIHDQVYAEPADSYTVTDATGKVSYVDHVIGKDFDVTSAKSKIAAGGTEWSFPLSLTLPAVTRQDLEAYTFPDVLATYTTEFSATNKARGKNLALAGEYINGMILEPGDEFSFNGVVGQRTPERGFSKATVYSSEGTDEDYGGGICQTSSTLYYCAIKANLEITERHNHLYTVAYMVDEKGAQSFGNDATVNWGTADMKFKNNKKYPIRLDCVATSSSITFTIMGTSDGYTAEFRYVEKAFTPYPICYRKYKDGKKNQAGQRGREIWTYRVIFYEGEEVDRYREHISLYNPLAQVKYVSPSQLPAGYDFDVYY